MQTCANCGHAKRKRRNILTCVLYGINPRPDATGCKNFEQRIKEIRKESDYYQPATPAEAVART